MLETYCIIIRYYSKALSCCWLVSTYITFLKDKPSIVQILEDFVAGGNWHRRGSGVSEADSFLDL